MRPWSGVLPAYLAAGAFLVGLIARSRVRGGVRQQQKEPPLWEDYLEAGNVHVGTQVSQALLPHATTGGGQWWLDRVLANWDGLTAERRKVQLRMLLVAAAYELINRAAVKSISLGPFQLRDLAFLQAVLPVVVAHQFMQARAIENWTAGYRLNARAAIRVLYPSITEHQAVDLVSPYQHVLDDRIANRDTGGRLTVFWTFTQTLVFGLAPVAFLIYAFTQLWSRVGSLDLFGVESLWYWLSLTATLIFVVRGFIYNYNLADLGRAEARSATDVATRNS